MAETRLRDIYEAQAEMEAELARATDRVIRLLSGELAAVIAAGRPDGWTDGDMHAALVRAIDEDLKASK